MARGQLGHNLPRRDLGGNLPRGPLAERASRLCRRFAGQRHDLADLWVRNPDGLAGPRRIWEALCDTEIGAGAGLEPSPPGSPQADGIDRDICLGGDLAVGGTSRGGEHQACPQGHLLGGTVASHELCQDLGLRISKGQRGRVGTTHGVFLVGHRTMTGAMKGSVYHRFI